MTSRIKILSDAVVADGHAKDVRGEILEGLLALTHRFGMDTNLSVKQTPPLEQTARSFPRKGKYTTGLVKAMSNTPTPELIERSGLARERFPLIESCPNVLAEVR